MFDVAQGQLYRQGDVLLVREDDAPVVAADGEWPRRYRRINGAEEPIVLAAGEITGHAHVVLEAEAVLHEFESGQRVLELPHEAVLRHEEHAPITLPAGRYTIIRQREWTDAAAGELMRERFVGD